MCVGFAKRGAFILKWESAVLFCVLLTWGMVPAFAAGIATDAPKNTAAFWQRLTPDGDAPVLSAAGVEAYNRAVVAASPSVYDLMAYPPAISAAQLRRWAQTDALEGALYRAGQPFGWAEKQALLAARNLSGLPERVSVRHGVFVRRTNLRTLPTAEGLFSSPGDSIFDVLQETAVDPSEAALILYESTAGDFYYVQTRNYRGWARAADIALAAPDEWRRYAAPPRFLVVVAHRFSLMAGEEQVLYQMGAKLPIVSQSAGAYEVLVPARTPAGALTQRTIRISADAAALHEGFLPYTRNQILQQSFRFLGEPYGWGGLADSVDCSSFIAAVYRTVGVELPRNADEQEQTAGVFMPLDGLTEVRRSELLHGLRPGDALFFDGHTMLYLGEADGAPYVIHALGSHTRHFAGGGIEKIRTMRVVVSDLSLRRYSGVSFLGALTSAKSYRPAETGALFGEGY